MEGQPPGLDQTPHVMQVVERKGFSGLGVFQAHESGPGKVGIVGLDRLLHTGKVKGAVGCELQRLRVNPPDHRGPASLEAVTVGLLSGNVFVAPLTVTEKRQEVRLGTAGDEKCGFHAKHCRGQFFEAIDCRVLAIDVVPHLGRGHGRAHGRGRPGNGIAPEIDPLHSLLLPLPDTP